MKQLAMQRYQEDSIILQQGDDRREMFKVLSGKVAVYFHFGQPDEYLVGILAEQRCFGEFSLLCGKPSVYTVVAVEEVLVLRITKDSFDDFIKNNPQNAIGIMKNLANTIATLSMNLNMLTEELTEVTSAKPDPQRLQDITLKIRQCAALHGVSRLPFTTQV